MDVGLWLFLVSLTGGSFGILIGGTVSDRVVKRSGLHARAWVLGASQLIASPFAFGVLLLPPPYCFFSLLLAYLFAETWFGILFAILIELVPTNVCGFFVAVFLFVMNNVGGNLPIIVAPLSKLMGFRESLLLLYPGFYLLSKYQIINYSSMKNSKNESNVSYRCYSFRAYRLCFAEKSITS